MAIKFVRADITVYGKENNIEAIVNSANPSPVIGGGTDSSIYKAAGSERLLKERKKIGNIDVGDAVATSGFDLCKIIIHTVGPNWKGGNNNEFEDLRSCYRKSLEVALKEQCRSVAFPLISTGVYGFPKAEALNIATSEINSFLLEHSSMEVVICIFDQDSFVLSGKIADNVEEFINKQNSIEKLKEEYGSCYDGVIQRGKQGLLAKPIEKKIKGYKYQLSEDPSYFSEKLKYYIRLSGEKPSVIYRDRAWLPRRTYSRIINGTHAPQKDAVLALCLALKLNVEQTADMLARNGMAFNPSDKFDRFIVQSIQKKIYDLDVINEGLFKLGLEQFVNRKDA